MAGWWHQNRPILISGLMYRFARSLGATLRVKTYGEQIADSPGAKIYLIWHGRTLVPGQHYRNKGLTVIISHSRDGEMQNRIVSRLGYGVIRGSTGRGGERALVESIRLLKTGASMAITPDGPRGPSGVMNPGVLLMAKKSGAALVPVGTSAKPRKLIGSWDSYLVPSYFAKAVIIAGDPIYVPADADDEAIEAIRLHVQGEMHRLQDEAERMLGFDTRSLPKPPKEES